jgi:hypothetical protein
MMGKELICTDSHARESVQELLEETHPWPTWGFVDEAMSHLRDCSRCQSDFADAPARLIVLRRNLERETRDEISSLRKSYLAAKYAAGVTDDEPSQSNLLAQLAAAGHRLGERLWSVNTSQVPWEPFSPLFAATDDNETTEAMVGAYSFIASLAQEDKEFAVMATAASSMFSKPWTLMPEERLDALNTEEDPAKRDVLLYEWAIEQSPISPVNFRRVLELGAANIAHEYLRVSESHAAASKSRQSAFLNRAEPPPRARSSG